MCFGWLKKMVEKNMKKLDFWDMPLIKLSALMFGLVLAKLFPEILNYDLAIYVGLFVLLAAKPCYDVYLKK